MAFLVEPLTPLADSQLHVVEPLDHKILLGSLSSVGPPTEEEFPWASDPLWS